MGEETFEAAESKMMLTTMRACLRKAAMTQEAVEVMLAGDLLNQLMASSFAARELGAHAGGSGCGCVASVTAGYILRRIGAGEIRRALVIASGALLSPTSTQQGESIPGIAYAVAFQEDS